MTGGVEGDWLMKFMAGVAAVVAAVIGVAVLAIHVTAASDRAPLPVAYGFDGSSGWSHGQVRPPAIYFGAGGNLLVRGLSWVSWTRKAAVARGARWWDSCLPTCAAGKYIKIPAIMSLSRVRIRHGISYFTRLILQWTISGRHYKSVYRWSHGPILDAPPFWS
jgi:hypothetical protein